VTSQHKVRLITCVGADALDKQELDVNLVDSAAMLVADSHEQSMQRGEFQHWIRCGGDKDKILTLDQVAATADLQRKERNAGLIILIRRVEPHWRTQL